MEVFVPTKGNRENYGAARSREAFQVLQASQDLGRVVWFLVPANMLQRRNANHEIVFLRRIEIYDIVVDETFGNFVLVDDIVINHMIVREDVPHF